MAHENYDEALRRLLISEGGYSNHPADPGGPTNFGITQRDYAAFKGRAVTAADVRAMTVDEAKEIYRTRYAAPVHFDDLPAGVDYAVFDYGVNSGIDRVGKVLRRVLGLPGNASAITSDVLAVIARRDAKEIIVAVSDERLRFLQSLKTWPVFGTGWGRRVADVKAAALVMATASKAMPLSSTKGQGRGVVPVNTGAQKTMAGGLIAAGVAVAHQVANAGAGVSAIVVILVTTAAIAALSWVGFRWWQKRKQQAAISA
jgi:lysozyme family protein